MLPKRWRISTKVPGLYPEKNSFRAENMVSLKLSQEAHQDEEGQLLSDLKKIKDTLFEIELDHQEQIRALRLKHSEEVGALQEKFLRESKEIESKGERNLVSLRAEMTLAHKMELTEVEERKNMQINILMRNHEQAFADAKNYYNDITLNNLALIGSLKEEMENLKQQTVRMEKQVRTLQAENKKLVEPLHFARKEVAELRRNLQNYERDKTCLSNTRLKLKNTEKELEDMKSANTVLELRFSKMKEERDVLDEKFNSTVLEIQQRLSLQLEIFNRKVQALQEALERKDIQLKETIRATNMDPTALDCVSQQIEEVLERKDASIRELQWEVTRITKAHDDLICTYEAKLRQYGIPESELGFEPLRLSGVPLTGRGSTHDASITIGKRQRLGPAGLVTVNQ